ncbi:DUF1127 domain-containing protein [Stagnihabitans tardus]|uniref:DUF1127 domain-containing protein n=1 Tax=Stagnihabitans tardus TaxID=2699202 RepID=A0AAE4YDU1_9RHOB|nr:DUF6455 family protein [Stagnihabitans tardus]NBZ89621.1 DUF1127 domain-containing protein [Stagnihabitans tardus]
MFERIKAMMERWNDLKEVDRLSEHELDDLGMTREQLRAFIQMPSDVGERVRHMGAVFGLSAEELQENHAQWIEILSTCGQCRHRGECAHLLAKRGAEPEEAGFCLNAETFAAEAARSAA